VRVHVNDDVIIEGYDVRAAEISPGTAAAWSVKTWAMCADRLPGQHIVAAPTAASSSRKKAVPAVCPSGERVIGSGGWIRWKAGEPALGGRVHLQIARPSATGDIVRVQAHEGVSGYLGDWSLVAYAICARPPDGYQVLFAKSSASMSESEKTAGAGDSDVCPDQTQMLSSGAAVSAAAPGNVSLFTISPVFTFSPMEPDRTIATAVENTPTPVNWGFIVATRVCAS
jgi:hypothetical protein